MEMSIITSINGGFRPKGSSTRTVDEIIKIFKKHGYEIELNQDIKNNSKLLAYTSEGYKVEAKPSRIENGIYPKVIDRNNPHTIWNINNIWLPKFAPDYELLDKKYINNKQKMTWILKNSDLPPFKMTWNNFSKLRRHPIIGKEIGISNRRTTGQEMMLLVENMINKNKRFQGLKLVIEEDYEYVDDEDVLFFKDNKGYISCQTARNIKVGYSPQNFTVKYPSVSTYNMYLWDKVENETERLLAGQVYAGADVKYSFICEKHGVIEKWIHDAFNGVVCKKCADSSRRGENHPFWDASVSEEERDNKRRSYEYFSWRKHVLERDDYTCQCCGSKENVIAHHKDGFNWCVKRRVDIENGIVLCRECHAIGEFAFHRIYGNGNNSEEQFDEWMKEYQHKILELKRNEEM